MLWQPGLHPETHWGKLTTLLDLPAGLSVHFPAERGKEDKTRAHQEMRYPNVT